ncbi:hypothetical protein Tco_0909983 [Tanacetum coccineum]|uniref:Uncharacterized protein n=1 Tax=Tanacetum coccineum TaxID=301880 RepID=A0ABQ5CRZ9_9ASTR
MVAQDRHPDGPTLWGSVAFLDSMAPIPDSSQRTEPGGSLISSALESIISISRVVSWVLLEIYLWIRLGYCFPGDSAVGEGVQATCIAVSSARNRYFSRVVELRVHWLRPARRSGDGVPQGQVCKSDGENPQGQVPPSALAFTLPWAEGSTLTDLYVPGMAEARAECTYSSHVYVTLMYRQPAGYIPESVQSVEISGRCRADYPADRECMMSRRRRRRKHISFPDADLVATLPSPTPNSPTYIEIPELLPLPLRKRDGRVSEAAMWTRDKRSVTSLRPGSGFKEGPNVVKIKMPPNRTPGRMQNTLTDITKSVTSHRNIQAMINGRSLHAALGQHYLSLRHEDAQCTAWSELKNMMIDNILSEGAK